jgi:hypothetical protein
MMALWAETNSVMSYYKTNKLIITQWDVNEILIVVLLRQEQNEEVYVFINFIFFWDFGITLLLLDFNGGPPLSSSQNISAQSEHSLRVTVFEKHTVSIFADILQMNLHHDIENSYQQAMLFENMGQQS